MAVQTVSIPIRFLEFFMIRIWLDFSYLREAELMNKVGALIVALVIV